MDFKDKVVLVTGSSAGIGKGIAVKFAEYGAKLIINSGSSVEAGQAVVKEIQQIGCEAIYVQADVSEPEQVKRLFAQSVAAFGRIDVLINNAGICPRMPFLETTGEHWVQVFNINIIGAMLCSQEAAKVMQEQGSGAIINTSSIRGLEGMGHPMIMAYSASKAALNSLTRTLAKELAPNITVNAVAAGFVYTPLVEKNFTGKEELKNRLLDNTLIKRFIQVDEIADAFLYLASSPVTTGEVLVVDGGFSLQQI